KNEQRCWLCFTVLGRCNALCGGQRPDPRGQSQRRKKPQGLNCRFCRGGPLLFVAQADRGLGYESSRLRLRLIKPESVRIGFGLLLLIFSLLAVDVHAQPTPESPVPLPVPFNPIVDNAQVIDAATRQRLESIYLNLKERGNIEFAV